MERVRRRFGAAAAERLNVLWLCAVEENMRRCQRISHHAIQTHGRFKTFCHL